MKELTRWKRFSVYATDDAYAEIGKEGLLECWQEYETVLREHGSTEPDCDCFYMVIKKDQAVWIFEKSAWFVLDTTIVGHR